MYRVRTGLEEFEELCARQGEREVGKLEVARWEGSKVEVARRELPPTLPRTINLAKQDICNFCVSTFIP